MRRSIDFVTQLTDPLPAIEGGEPERREGGEAASGSSGVEPLEDGPEQAGHARLDDERHLLPVCDQRKAHAHQLLEFTDTVSPNKLT